MAQAFSPLQCLSIGWFAWHFCKPAADISNDSSAVATKIFLLCVYSPDRLLCLYWKAFLVHTKPARPYRWTPTAGELLAIRLSVRRSLKSAVLPPFIRREETLEVKYRRPWKAQREENDREPLTEEGNGICSSSNRCCRSRGSTGSPSLPSPPSPIAASLAATGPRT